MPVALKESCATCGKELTCWAWRSDEAVDPDDPRSCDGILCDQPWEEACFRHFCSEDCMSKHEHKKREVL